jgi:hypothetical protein
VQAEPAPPFRQVILRLRPVDDGQPGLACEPENFHLSDVDLQKGLRSVDHIDDSRVFLNNWSKKAAFSLKVRLPTMPRQEIPKQRQRLGCPCSRLELTEGLDGVLKTRRVIKSEEVAQPESLAGDGLSRHRADSYLIIFSERRDDGRLSVVHRPDNGEGWNGLAHGRHLSKPKRRS